MCRKRRLPANGMNLNIAPYRESLHKFPSLQVQESKADAAVVYPVDFIRAHDLQLKKVMKEVIDPENVYVVVADKNINSDLLKKVTL